MLPSAQSRANQEQGNQGSTSVSFVVWSFFQNVVLPSLSRKAHVTHVPLTTSSVTVPGQNLKPFSVHKTSCYPVPGQTWAATKPPLLAQPRFSAGSVSWQPLTPHVVAGLSPLPPWIQGHTSELEGPTPSCCPPSPCCPYHCPTALPLRAGRDQHFPAFYCSQN